MRVNTIAAMLASLGLWLAPALGVFAQDAGLPTPRVVIYPGSVIQDDMLTDLPAGTARGPGPFAETRAALIGKMARQTLLPGGPIPLSALENPRLVTNGSQVRLVYVEGGLTIVTVGAALQDGVAGAVVKVRNSDSGVTVSGEVQADGTVLVSGG
jgi:flagellar basal body P-ring formation protein FlgA